MGSVGGLLGLSGGEGGTGFSTPSGTNSGQLQTAYQNAQNALGTQQNVYGQFQNIAAGQGPNPAQAMLNQATGQNVAQQAALMAGQRGAAQNVGLLARQAGQQGMQAQQAAAGQGASMQAQQQLGALGQAGQMASDISHGQQNEQSILQQANNANNAIHGQLANTTMQGQQAMIGGVMNGIGGAMGLANGGQIPNYDMGGQVGPQSMFGQTLNLGNWSGPMPYETPQYSSSNPGADSIKKAFDKKPKKPKDPMSGATDITSSSGGVADAGGGLGSLIGDAGMIAAKGGSVGDQLKNGGYVPGQAKVKGNSYSNDTVKALLSPGEVVIPRSVMTSGDPVRGAAQFVQSVLAKKKGR